MRDPKSTPHPGDRFRCKNGTELEATGAVISVTKTGGETPCLDVSRIVKGWVVSCGVSTLGVFKSSIRTAELVTRGSDDNPWPPATQQLFDAYFFGFHQRSAKARNCSQSYAVTSCFPSRT